MFFFITNHLISTNQSGSLLGDSCINQLLSIAHEIHASFYFCERFEVLAVFIEKLEAFHKVWYGGLIFKLKPYGTSDRLTCYKRLPK